MKWRLSSVFQHKVHNKTMGHMEYKIVWVAMCLKTLVTVELVHPWWSNMALHNDHVEQMWVRPSWLWMDFSERGRHTLQVGEVLLPALWNISIHHSSGFLIHGARLDMKHNHKGWVNWYSKQMQNINQPWHLHSTNINKKRARIQNWGFISYHFSHSSLHLKLFCESCSQIENRLYPRKKLGTFVVGQ